MYVQGDSKLHTTRHVDTHGVQKQQSNDDRERKTRLERQQQQYINMCRNKHTDRQTHTPSVCQ